MFDRKVEILEYFLVYSFDFCLNYEIFVIYRGICWKINLIKDFYRIMFEESFSWFGIIFVERENY